jgi:hypothetical protein
MNQERFNFRGGAVYGETRPSFLCIGQPHSGTTWLHGALATHPQVRLPENKKDVDFFCFNYHLGERWYLEHFAGHQGDIRQVGEVGPMYIYSELAPSRIAAFGSIDKLIVMLRDPSSWFVSRYHAINKFSRFTRDRALFLKHHAAEFDMLRVHSYLSNYFDVFDRQNFLFVTLDELCRADIGVKQKLADFLEIEFDGFGQAMPSPLYNQARQPRFRPLYSAARNLRDRYFRDFEWITAVEQRAPILTQLLFQEPAPPPDWLFEELHIRRESINEQTKRLGDAIDRDLSGWLIG